MKAKKNLDSYTPTNMRLASELHSQARELAQETGRSLSKMLNILIKEALAARSNGQKELRHV